MTEHSPGGRRRHPSRTSSRRAPAALDTSFFVILLMIVLVLFAQALQNTMRLNRDRAALESQIAQQRETLNEARKVRAQLEAIAGDTATLAEVGNPNAILLRDFLAEQGVTIRPPAP